MKKRGCKFSKKVMVLLLSTIVCGGMFAGCGNPGEKTDETKTQLYVGNFDAGFGNQWLYDIAEKFEAEYAGASYEAGKTGVQIFVDPQTSYAGTTLKDSIAKNKNDVFFTEQVYYDEMVKNNLLLDISDVVKGEAKTGEGTLESKLPTYQKDILETDGKYYALPHYQIFSGLVYDMDLFENELLYFSDTVASGQRKFVTSKTEKRSPGPNGIYENNGGDDGFPQTFDEFKRLIKYMAEEKQITPFIWAGVNSKSYLHKMASSIASAYNGEVGQYSQAIFDSQGQELEVVTDFNGDTPIIEKKSFTQADGYYSKQLAGTYYALDLIEYVLDGEYYTDSSAGSSTQIQAQEEYIYSYLEGEPIGFLLEGGYWEGEAAAAIERSIQDFGEAEEGELVNAANRNFGMFPFPSAEGVTATMTDTAGAYAFINANIKDEAHTVKLAKDFLKYCYTNQAQGEFFAETGAPRSMNFNLDTGVYNTLTTYQKSLWEQREANGWTAIYSSNSVFLKSMSKFSLMPNTSFWESTINDQPYKTMYSAIGEDGVSAKDYFKGLWVQSDWASKYNK